MKKKSPPYAIIGAIVLGLIAVYAFYLHDKSQKEAAAAALKAQQDALQAQIDAANASKTTVSVASAPTNMRGVLYATQPVEPGVKISAAFYETKLTPIDILPDAYSDKSDIVGWYATRKIEKGDPLTPRNIGKSLPYLSQRITPGMRAITLPIFTGGDVNDTGGFAVDGDRVDLLATTESQDGKYEFNTQTVLQNVPVLFAPGSPVKTDKSDGINPVPSTGGAVAVTFEVTPEEAQALIFLSQAKNLHFSMILRSRRDDTQVKVKSFNAEDYDLLKLTKLQKTVDRSDDRVKQLTDAIEAQEKTQGSQGNTNEITTPTPPSP